MLHPVTAFLSVGSTSFWEQIATWYQNSTLGELISYFQETYFSIRFGAYDNFSISLQTANAINKMIPTIILGIIIAAVATVFCRRVEGDFVRTLLKNEAFCPQAGMTLLSTGAFRSVFIRHELCHSAFLRKVVFCREEQAFLEEKGKDATYKIDFTRDHFYIPEDLKYRAENRFNFNGSNWMSVVLTVVLVPIFVGLLCRFIPSILQLFDSLITFLAP